MKQFADRYGVCVLIVHHIKKHPADDSCKMISSTAGLLVSADGALPTCKEQQTDSKAKMNVVIIDRPYLRL